MKKVIYGMKKEIIFGFFSLFILLIGISFVYAACDDDDGGLDYDVQEEVFDEDTNTTYEDYCSGDVVHEYWCDGDTVAVEEYTCFETCSDGACAEYGSGNCEDTDNGKNYYEKAWTEVTIDGYIDKDYDYCSTTTELVEQYCEEGENKEETFTCSAGCVNGACSTAGLTCTDSDGGKDYNKTGSATKLGTENATDVCTGTAELKEYYCENNEVTSETYTCGYLCNSGKCITEAEESEIECDVDDDCDDGYGDDYCIDNSIYHDYNDYSCVGGKCVSTPEPAEVGGCSEDHECQNGECVEKSLFGGGGGNGDEDGDEGSDGKPNFLVRFFRWLKRLFGGGE